MMDSEHPLVGLWWLIRLKCCYTFQRTPFAVPCRCRNKHSCCLRVLTPLATWRRYGGTPGPRARTGGVLWNGRVGALSSWGLLFERTAKGEGEGHVAMQESVLNSSIENTLYSNSGTGPLVVLAWLALLVLWESPIFTALGQLWDRLIAQRWTTYSARKRSQIQPLKVGGGPSLNA